MTATFTGGIFFYVVDAILGMSSTTFLTSSWVHLLRAFSMRPSYDFLAARDDPRMRILLELAFEDSEAGPNYVSSVAYHSEICQQNSEKASYRLGMVMEDAVIGILPIPGIFFCTHIKLYIIRHM